MISDSPYKVDALALSPIAGLFSGIVAAFFMLGVVELMSPYSGMTVASVLTQFATLVLPGSFENMQTSTLVSIGLGVHLLIRMILALLYSVSQQSIPVRGLVAVGLFFGFINWMAGSVIFGIAFHEEWRVSARSWTWLIANLVFGLSLALVSIILQAVRPSPVLAVPKD